jgi:hypothetical protein
MREQLRMNLADVRKDRREERKNRRGLGTRTEDGGGEVHVAAVAGGARDRLVEPDEQPQRVELPPERQRQADDRPRPARSKHLSHRPGATRNRST